MLVNYSVHVIKTYLLPTRQTLFMVDNKYSIVKFLAGLISKICLAKKKLADKMFSYTEGNRKNKLILMDCALDICVISVHRPWVYPLNLFVVSTEQ